MEMRKSCANLQLWIGYRSSRREGWEQRQRGGEQKRLQRQLLRDLLSLLRPNEAEPGVFLSTVYSEKLTSALYANEKKLVQDKSTCTHSAELHWNPHTHTHNYRWTSHVHGHQDISEPVSSPQPFIKHWQFSAIIITGRENAWLNRI